MSVSQVTKRLLADYSVFGGERQFRLTPSGVPSDSIVAQYPLVSGTVGAGWAGPYPDGSGLGRDATYYRGEVTPIQRAAYLEVTNVNGFLMRVPRPFPRSFTYIVAVSATASQANIPSEMFYGLIQPTNHGFPSAPITNGSLYACSPWLLCMGIQVHPTDAASHLRFVIVGAPAVPLIVNIPKAQASAGDLHVVAFSMDDVAGKVSIDTLNGGHAEYSNALLIGYNETFESVSEPIIGVSPYSNVRPSAWTIKLGEPALYSGVISAAQRGRAMREIAKRMVARGLTPQGYAP